MTSLCSSASHPLPTLCILSHVTHTHESRHIRMRYVTYERVLSIKSLHHVWMCHVRYDWVRSRMIAVAVQFITRHCKTLQDTARHCKTLQHTATHCNTLQHTATHCKTLQDTATHCNTLRHTTAHMAEWHRVWMSRVAHGEIHMASELGPFIGLFPHVQVYFGISTHLRTGNSMKYVSMCVGLFCRTLLLCIGLFWHFSQTSEPAIVQNMSANMYGSLHMYRSLLTYFTDLRTNNSPQSEPVAFFTYHCLVTWLIHVCDMTQKHVWHVSFICMFLPYHCLLTRRTHMNDIAHSYVWHGSLICATWLNHVCGMTHSYVRHGSLIYATWLTHMCEKAHLHMGHGLLIYVAWLTHTWDIIRS